MQSRRNTRPSARPWAFLVAFALAQALACASNEPEVSSAFDPLERFPAQATFVWDEAASRVPDDPRLRDLALASRIRRFTTEVLAARGYRETTSGPADYRLSYQLSVVSWISADHSTSVGSLSIAMADVPTGRRVFMGFARAEVRIGLPERERNARLRRIIERMFERFPPS